MIDTSTPDSIWPDDLEECDQHGGAFDATCQKCLDEMETRGKVIDRLNQSTSATLDNIRQSGGPSMPPDFILQGKIDLIIDTMLPNPKDRIRFEAELGRRILASAKDMQEMVKQPRLHLPGRNGLSVVKE